MLQNARTPEEAVTMEQLRAISQNIPALYLMLTVAAIALGATFIGNAPTLLTVGVPGIFVALSTIRLAFWKFGDSRLMHPEEARTKLKQVEVLTSVLFLFLGVWVWTLLPYASGEERLYLSFFTAFTGASSTICAISRPRLVGVCLFMTLGVFCLLFFDWNERFYFYATMQLGVTYLVFFLASRTYKMRLAQSVVLLNRLNAENRRSSELADTNESMALTDMLTGLPNRRQFFQDVEASYDPKTDEKLPVIGLIDLDGFKPINDVFGHTAGDTVLVETARRLKRVLGDKASVSRLGGDEFAYILPRTVSQKEAKRIAQQIVNAMNEPVQLPNRDTSRVSASVGYSSRAFAVKSAHDLLEQADFALFRAKEHKVGQAIEFSASHAESQLREAVVHQALKKADLEKELRLVFQPIVNSTDGAVNRCEALARWDSPQLGSVPPLEFVAIAEKMGMTQQLTRVVVRKALEQLRRWPELPSMSVNLSAQDIISRETSDSLVAMILAEPESVRERLVLEVTESSLLNDMEEARYNLMKFRFMGLKIALDDFGTGYSSLRYLQELEFDIVKIDRSFGAAINTTARGLGLVATIQHLCRSLAIECIIEGIETREQLETARSAGCRLVQGYLYAAPLDALELHAYLTGEKKFPSYRELLEGPARDVA
ncbi:diguanylate cyclase/phosphodiesterase [Hyphomonas adhaerens MHS-3]|uniref:Diguanylate cyclase/phosphodiesterase n=2 Tax=Hyphomonas adhaerens TaxID=81029 RepID=A0A069E9E8_9PROT|nr:diguanylate cyclase/phosphodiesterase [Hyphomonas adhaerens MHS-3]